MNLNIKGFLSWVTSLEGLATIGGACLGHRYYGKKWGKWPALGAGMTAGYMLGSLVTRFLGPKAPSAQPPRVQEHQAPLGEYVSLDAPQAIPGAYEAPPTGVQAAAQAPDMSSLEGGWGQSSFEGASGLDGDADGSGFMADSN